MNSSLLLILVSALLNALAQITWKYGLSNPVRDTHSFAEKILALLTNTPFMGGFLLYGVSIIIWIVVLSKVEVSYAYPILSLSYIFVIFGGYFLGEALTPMRLLGAFCIMLGILFIARS